MRSFRLLSAAVIVVAASLPCAAQSVISAKSGTLHFFTGQVSIDGVDQHMKAGIFPMVRQDSVLRTKLGRAEILLTPGVFLRVNDDSAVRMLDTDLAHTRVEVISGNAMVEADDPLMSVKNAPVTLVSGDIQIRIVKHGLVGISTDANQVKVYRGEAEVATGATTLTLKEGRVAALSGDLKAEKFDVKKEGDDFLTWSRDRSASLSASNLYAAGTMRSAPGYGLASSAWGGGWYYNSFFDSFTFIPSRGTLWNPWGYGFYSPGTIFGYDGISPVWFRSVVVANNGALGRNGGIGIRPPQIARPAGEAVGPRPTLGPGAARGAFVSSAFVNAATGTAVAHRTSSSVGFGGGGFGGGGFANAASSGPVGGGALSSGASAGAGMARPAGSVGGGGAAMHSSGHTAGR